MQPLAWLQKKMLATPYSSSGSWPHVDSRSWLRPVPRWQVLSRRSLADLTHARCLVLAPHHPQIVT
jgi:hypothetical protein